MDKNRYFQCQSCGQVVQGWHAAMEWINCCTEKNMVEIHGPGDEVPNETEKNKFGEFVKV